MTDIIEAYSPNIAWGIQHVEVVLKQWDYEATHVVKVGGNCTGAIVIEAAIGLLYDTLPIASVYGRDYVRVSLTRARDGEVLTCDDEEDESEDWLKRMVVSARIIAWDAPTLNEVRAKNGAKPLPDGDRPWQPL